MVGEAVVVINLIVVGQLPVACNVGDVVVFGDVVDIVVAVGDVVVRGVVIVVDNFVVVGDVVVGDVVVGSVVIGDVVVGDVDVGGVVAVDAFVCDVVFLGDVVVVDDVVVEYPNNMAKNVVAIVGCIVSQWFCKAESRFENVHIFNFIPIQYPLSAR